MEITKYEQVWLQHYNEVMDFMQKNKRRPSKHKTEDNVMFEWIKYNKKRMVRGQMPEHRVEKFKRLLRLAESMTRVNQYNYQEDKRRRRILGVQLIHSEEFTL